MQRCLPLHFLLFKALFHFYRSDGAMAHAEATAVAFVGSCQNGVGIEIAGLRGHTQFECECGAFFNADGAAVAQLGIDNGLLPLLSGNEFGGLAVLIEDALVFTDIAAGTAVDTAIGVYLMLFLHLAGDRSYGADFCAIVAALASIGNFM